MAFCFYIHYYCSMKFNNPIYENEELTYQDVFLFQQYFDGTSRIKDTDITPTVPMGTSVPIVISNMNTVAGKRMAETMARCWWLCVLPQDMDDETLKRIILYIKNANSKYDTPIVVKSTNTVRDVTWLMYKRDHHCVILIDESNRALGILKPKDLDWYDQFTLLENIAKRKLITANENISDEDAFLLMDNNWISALPIVDGDWVLKWILTKKNTVRNSIYKPTLDSHNKLDVAVAIWINSSENRMNMLYDLWIRIFVLDTAHWYQRWMIEFIKKCRNMFGDSIHIIAWNVITAEATKALIEAGANWVKVGIGPWAMCTTRMQTWVWRPQFTAVYKCSQVARQLWWFVWADGWVKEPRDMILALAAWASHVMWWSIFSWTYESVWDIKYDENGLMYKESYGMASKKAVLLRSKNLTKFEQARKQLFREGISTSKIYLKQWRESALDIVDEFTAWLRSAMTYVWAKTLEEFHEKALIWVQTSAGYFEWTPNGKVLK